MSSLSKYFVDVLRKELNLQVLSSAINYGIWASDHEVVDLREVVGTNLGTPMGHEQYFGIHEANFNELLQVTDGIPTRLDELIGGDSEEADGAYATYIAEILVNIPSILIMLNRLADAKTLIRKCMEICVYNEGKVPIQMANIKLHLMEASISIHQGDCQNKVTVRSIEGQLDALWSDGQNSDDRGGELLDEYSNLGIVDDAKGEVHFLRAVYLIKVLESYLRTNKLDEGLDEDVSPTKDRGSRRAHFALQGRGASVEYDDEPKNVIKSSRSRNNKSINDKMMELSQKEFVEDAFEEILHHFSESIDCFQESHN